MEPQSFCNCTLEGPAHGCYHILLVRYKPLSLAYTQGTMITHKDACQEEGLIVGRPKACLLQEGNGLTSQSYIKGFGGLTS